MSLAASGLQEAAESSTELRGMALRMGHGSFAEGSPAEHTAAAQFSAAGVAAELSRLRALAPVIGERLADEDRLDGLQARLAGLAQRRQEPAAPVMTTQSG